MLSDSTKSQGATWYNGHRKGRYMTRCYAVEGLRSAVSAGVLRVELQLMVTAIEDGVLESFQDSYGQLSYFEFFAFLESYLGFHDFSRWVSL